jgi:acetoin utilization deacetylase AcuC-like enzyme
VVYHDAYEVDLGPHVFPVAKYRLVRDRLIAEGILTEASLHRPVPAPDADVGLVHTADYLGKIRDGSFTARELAALEVPFTPSLRQASWLCAGGSVRTARLALEHGIAVHLGGGFHHAFPDHGEGFCLIHDVAVAIQVLRRDGAIRRALVVDLDVHHGNGTALIFAGDPEVFCFSMHQQNNYPAWKPAGSLDVGLADGTGDDAYLAILDAHLDRIVATHAPQLVWYLAGADPYEHDQLGGLRLTMAGLRRRDERVLSAARAGGTPVAVALAGGYAARLEDTVEIHCQTVRAAAAALAAD